MNVIATRVKRGLPLIDSSIIGFTGIAFVIFVHPFATFVLLIILFGKFELKTDPINNVLGIFIRLYFKLTEYPPEMNGNGSNTM